MIKEIKGQRFDEERALYNLSNARVFECVFAGEADGESAMKESRDITVSHCRFSLRYPLWHSHSFTLSDSVMDEGVRAPLWYSEDGRIERCRISGVKCLRECRSISMEHCTATSAEFGWRCSGVSFTDCDISSEYFLFESSDITARRLTLSGKYSFQYVRNMTITDSVLNTKDAFWHTSGVTVRDTVINGEYLGWYSDGLTLINCRISGTQPFCYCSNLHLINCTTEGCDLSFEYSDTQADIVGDILSVKNPASGTITADSIGKVILSDSVIEPRCRIIIRNRD